MGTGRVVLITGGASFLGEHLAPALARTCAAVRVFDRVPEPAWAHGHGIEYAQGDVREPAAVTRAVAGVDAVIHAAFASPREPASVIQGVNEEATRRLLVAARQAGVRRFVLVSSTIVHMRSGGHPFGWSPSLRRLDLYGRTRLAAERLVEAHAGGDFAVAVARPATFLGPGRVAAFAFIFDWIRRGGVVPVLGPGHARYQLLDVRDLADGVGRLAVSEISGQFDFGAREVASVRVELEALIAYAGTGARLWCIPARLARTLQTGLDLLGFAPLSEWHRRTARQEDWVLDVSEAEQRLGWRATRTNLQALTDAYDWYVQRVVERGTAPTPHPAPRGHRLLRRVVEWLVPRP